MEQKGRLGDDQFFQGYHVNFYICLLETMFKTIFQFGKLVVWKQLYFTIFCSEKLLIESYSIVDSLK